ncbi:MAG TPA: ATP-binding protein [Kofleriaceae bacterium]|jgi:plasmid stability protein
MFERSYDLGGAPASARYSLARIEYELQLHAALLRTMRAMLQTQRVQREQDHPALAQIVEELELVEHNIADLPYSPDDRPMLGLASRLGCSEHEIGFLWTVVALAVNPRMLVHARGLDDTASRGMSVSLHGRIANLEADASRALGLLLLPGHPTSRNGLLVPARGEWVPAALPWMPATELILYLAGEPTSVTVLSPVVPPAEGALLDEAQQRAVAHIRAVLGNRQALLLYVEGAQLTGRRTAVALASGGPVLALDLANLSPSPDSLSEALIVLRREAALRGATRVIAGIEELMSAEGGKDPRMRLLAQHLNQSDEPVVLVSSWRGIDVGAQLPAVRIEWPIPDVTTRGELWRELACAPAETAAELDLIAHRFPLGAGAIRRAISSALVIAGKPPGSPLGPAELQAGIRQNVAEQLGGLAERVVIRQTWNELILADDVMTRVVGLVGRVRHAHMVYEQWGYRAKMPRGVGVAALFSGPPGTGKTMVAGLIANELELELYQVDLSKVVSKWIGETEKQLAKVFDAAEAGHVLLLFDEADALFGQRSTEMRGATDRYANLEVNFLLQRIERFNGIVILTTNLDASLDKALKRRLAAHVVFQHPDEDERAQLWTQLLSSEGAPIGRDIDARKLSRLYPQMTGANIRNAALSAAFLAAAEGRSRIDQATVMQAARGEYLSMGHVLAATSEL